MPGLGFGEQRFHPDLALAHGLPVGLWGVVAAHALEVRLVEAAADAATAGRGRALGAQWTDGAGPGRCLVDPTAGRLTLRQEAQHRAAGAVINIGFSVIREVVVAEHPRPLPDRRQRHVGADPLVLDGDDVGNGAVFRVAGDLPRAQLPAAPRPPEQIEGGLVFLHLGWRDQSGQDDPGTAAINDRVILIAEARAAVATWHQGGVRIGGADLKVCRAAAGAARLVALGATSLADPVRSMLSALGQFGARLRRSRNR